MYTVCLRSSPKTLLWNALGIFLGFLNKSSETWIGKLESFLALDRLGVFVSIKCSIHRDPLDEQDVVRFDVCMPPIHGKRLRNIDIG